MSVPSGEGLREGTDGYIVIQLVAGYEAVDGTGRTVTVAASFDGGATEFNATVASVDEIAGRYKVSFTAAQLDQAGDLALEVTVTGGSDPVNPNAKPIIVPVRARFAEAS